MVAAYPIFIVFNFECMTPKINAFVHYREFYSALGFGILAVAGGSSSGDLVYMSRSF